MLVTDDEPITRMLVKLLLEREQFEVLEAANGRDAVEIAIRERPDLLMIDLNMPEMDGYEAIARVRREMALAMMPILVLTSEEGRASSAASWSSAPTTTSSSRSIRRCCCRASTRCSAG